MKVERCKGTQDLSPEEMARFRRIESAFRDCCRSWGYQEVRTPTLEYLHLFTATGTLTPSMLHKVYSFLDWDGWSGERVVLRPDGTIPVARFYIDQMAGKGPAKLFYVTNVFRFEGSGTEARERWQCGAELIGAGSATADVELIVMALEVLRRMGIKGVELRLSHAGLIRGLLAGLGLSLGEESKIFERVLDEGVRTLVEVQPESSKLAGDLIAVLGVGGKSSAMLKNLKTLVKSDLPELEPALGNFVSILDLLATLGYDCQVELDSFRGFEYYTGVIFQLFAGEARVGAGGRYDALIPVLGGSEVPASGFALYVDRLMNLLPPSKAGAKIEKVLIRAEPRVIKEGFNIVAYLHQAGYIAEINLGADEANYRWLLDIRGQPPRLVLTDRVRSRKFEMQTASEVLAALGDEGASKNRPA